MGMTKEQKKAQKEAKLLQKLKEEEALRKRLKLEELKREVTAMESRREGLDKTWHDMMYKIKEPIFKQEVNAVWHLFERILDKKDQTVKLIIKLLNAAEDQFGRTVAAFCVRIDAMNNTFIQDLNTLDEENDKAMAEFLKNFEETNTKLNNEKVLAETKLQLLIYHARTTADALEWTNRGENMVKQDEERAKFEEDRDNLRSFLENNYNNTWDMYKAVLKAYIVNTADNQKQVRILRHKEQLMSNIIHSQGKKIANNGSVLKRLRQELAAYESGTKQAAFRDRRNRYREACFRLKKNMNDGVTTDAKNMVRLVKATNDTLEWLETLLSKIEKMLKMAALCRKMETRREKVLPFNTYAPHDPIECVRSESDDAMIKSSLSSTSGLTRLWHRIAKADLSKRALLREKYLLEEENRLLLEHQVAKANDVSTNSLACICGNIDLKKRQKFHDHPYRPASIEASIEIAKYAKSRKPL